MENDGDAEQKRDTAGAGDGEDAAQVTNSLFPAPPSVFKRFTRDNVARLRVLQAAHDDDRQTGLFDWTCAEPAERVVRQEDVLHQETERRYETLGGGGESEVGNVAASAALTQYRATLEPAPVWDVLLAMAPPNVDWIEEDGHYTCFGEQWPVREVLPSLEQMGMPRIYPSNGNAERGVPFAVTQQERSVILTTLLRTMLRSYLGLIDILLAQPREYLASERDPVTGQITHQEWRFTTQDKAREINDISINFMHLLNEIRPLQAREQLRELMREQLVRRREDARVMKSQCAVMRQEIEAIRDSMRSDVVAVKERNES